MTRGHGAGSSRPERDRSANEDSYYADDELGLYVVCDGAGGAAAGEIASQIAVDAVAKRIEQAHARGRGFANTSLATQAVRAAFTAIYAREQAVPAFRGMNTTVTMLLLRDDRAVVGHVGDSRMYVVRGETLSQMTQDHPLTTHTSGDPSVPEPVAVDTFRFSPRVGDTYLLCTDGLNPVMADERWVVEVVKSKNLDWIADRLLARSIHARADTTIIVVRVAEQDDRMRVMHYIDGDFDLFQSMAIAATGP